MRPYLSHRARGLGFTLPEVLVVIGVIAVLIAVLLPALYGARRTADMGKSQSNLKQIAAWLTMYSSENREFIVPSQFDYTASAASGYPVKVRSDSSLGSLRYQGTWTDILWTYYNLGAGVGAAGAMPEKFRFDSPDKTVYDDYPDYAENVFRAAAPNSRDYVDAGGNPGNGPKPFGTGAAEAAYSGFFAANNFFNMTLNGNTNWFVTGQIKAPERSMYLVDSFAGETIEAALEPFDNEPSVGPGATIEVDFRYTGVCLMLFMDGHSAPQTPWADLPELEQQRRIKVRNLDRN